MKERGFTSILFIFIILVISAGIISGAFYIKQSNLSNKQLNKQPEAYVNTTSIDQPAQPSLESSPIQSAKLDQAPKSAVSNNEAARFTGMITETNNSCWVDGVCSVKIDSSWVEVERGGLRPPNMMGEPGGQLIGISFSSDTEKYIGQKAEFYGAKKDDGSFTIYGNSNYYLKLVN
ncbi:hypothetical protein HYU93_04315 [Candidatus Daviesbacteria bacterium]|nr:hypothetical protein [Candidatus Daviesbacteria bacterium]